MTDPQLDAFAELAQTEPQRAPNGGTVAEPAKPPTGSEARTATNTAARFWKTRTSQPDPLSRATITERITGTSNTDDKWKKCNKQIDQLLTDANVAK
jgi:hypothetical protein